MQNRLLRFRLPASPQPAEQEYGQGIRRGDRHLQKKKHPAPVPRPQLPQETKNKQPGKIKQRSHSRKEQEQQQLFPTRFLVARY